MSGWERFSGKRRGHSARLCIRSSRELRSTGPVLKDRIFTSLTFDQLGFRSSAIPRIISSHSDPLPRRSIHEPCRTPAATLCFVSTQRVVTVRVGYRDPPTALNQTSVVERTDFVTKTANSDYVPRGASRFLRARAWLQSLSWIFIRPGSEDFRFRLDGQRRCRRRLQTNSKPAETECALPSTASDRGADA